jgi:hypothetical protein
MTHLVFRNTIVGVGESPAGVISRFHGSLDVEDRICTRFGITHFLPENRNYHP